LKNLGYEIYNTKTKYLPTGMDLVADINKIFPDLSQINTVFDVGANIGQTAVYFDQKLPNASILSFEPVKQSFDELQKNTANLKKITCFNHAFGDKNETRKITIKKRSGLNSLVDNANSHSDAVGEEIVADEMVDVKKIDSFASDKSIDTIDLLKIDTEGYEMQVIQGAMNYMKDNRVKLIFCELGWNENDKGHTFFPDIYFDLSNLNFKLYALYDFHNNYRNGSFGLIYCNGLFVNSKAIKHRIEPKWWLM